MHTSVVSQKIHRPSKTCKGADSLTLCSKVLCYSYKDQTFCLLLEFSKAKKLVFMSVPRVPLYLSLEKSLVKSCVSGSSLN